MRCTVDIALATTRIGSTPVQKAAWVRKSFEYGTWGGEIRSEFVPQPGDIVALEH
jgi:nicotinamidase-related amidase